MSIKKRVLVLTSTFPRWQGDNEPPFVFELSRRLRDRFEVLVLAPHAEGAKQIEKMDGIEIVRFRYFFPRWEKLAYQGGILANLKRNRWSYLLLPLFILAQLVALRRILRHQHVDVIHAHWLIPQGLALAILGVLVKDMPPWICTSHGGDLLGLNGPLLIRLKRWIIHSTSLLTVVSNTMMDRARSLGAKMEQRQIVSMGVDTKTLFTPDRAVPRGDNQLLFVGRLVEKKGVSYLLDAMQYILKQRPDTRLSIIGDGPMEHALKRKADHLGVSHAVTFHGSVNNAETPGFYKRAAVFVAPSIVTAQGDQEGLGLVLVEALACECPVIASDLPAIRDVVIDGVNGLICRQKDSADLAAKVCYLLEHPELREAMGVAGRRYVQSRFDWTTIASCYAALIDELAQGGS